MSICHSVSGLRETPAAASSAPQAQGNGHDRGDDAAPSPDAVRSLAFSCSSTAMAVADAEMRIVDANAAYAQLTGIAPEQLVGTLLPVAKPCADTHPAQDGDRLPARHASQGRVQCRHRSGQTRTLWMNLNTISSAAGQAQFHVATFTDIDALEAEQAMLRHWAQHDPLTDLSNRRLFDSELQRCAARAQRHAHSFGLVFLDLDHFKWINDTLGHDAGDAVLQEVARRLRKAVRAEDLVARWGGDEFIVVLDDLPHHPDVCATVTTLKRAIQRPISISGHQVKVSASMGVAVFPEDAGTVDALVNTADRAMFVAKRRGPGHIAFSKSLRTTAASPSP